MAKRLLFFIPQFFLFGLLQAQIVYDGNITEGYWSSPLGTSAGGPASCLGSNFHINSLYAAANDAELQFGIGGMVQAGTHLVLFIDCKPGGFNQCSFSKLNAPPSLINLPPATKFDVGFSPDYCMVIGYNSTNTIADFNLFQLDSSVGILSLMGRVNGTVATPQAGFKIGATPSSNDFTKGYEIGILKSILGYNANAQAIVQLMPMLISDNGGLANQFITHADIAVSTCLGKGLGNAGVQFQNEAAINPVAYNPSKALPIDFLYFRAGQLGQNIKLLWASALEKEILAYEVERSNDAINFNKIGTVPAKGNTSSETAYSFDDNQPSLGKSYYRIKAIDLNGRTTFSIIVIIQYGRVDNTLAIYPNPVKDQINLQIIGIKPGIYTLDIFNDAGQKLITKSITYNGGYGLQQIPVLLSMKKGPYRLLLRNKAVFYKQNFLVQ